MALASSPKGQLAYCLYKSSLLSHLIEILALHIFWGFIQFFLFYSTRDSKVESVESGYSFKLKS